ncbi:MAG: UDP-N-acetylglucosamine 1-carboxyvinyltransferase [Candidatus Dormibacteria bacterium]
MTEVLRVTGGAPLRGVVPVGGSKNACLPLMAACLLSSGRCRLTRVPPIEDVRTMVLLLRHLGATVDDSEPGALTVEVAGPLSGDAPQALTRLLRASILLLGPLLARRGSVSTTGFGGDDIGLRRIDQHLMGFRALGATVDESDGRFDIRAEKLHGTGILLDLPTVTGTENILMASVLARGTTTIRHAAREPHVVDLARFLVAMGARIAGVGTDTITVEGVETLGGTEHEVSADYIEAGSFALLAAAAGGPLEITGADPGSLELLLHKLQLAGAEVEVRDGSVRVERRGELLPVDLTTWSHPGFPTDLQAPYTALMTQAKGTSVISESMYENRYQHVPELVRMGAKIRVQDRNAEVRGPVRLRSASLQVPDIRSGFALVLAALVAEGESEISGVAHLDRGYERLDAKLRALGARVERTGVAAPATAAGYE